MTSFSRSSPLYATTTSIGFTSSQKVWKRLHNLLAVGCRNLIDSFGRFHGHSSKRSVFTVMEFSKPSHSDEKVRRLSCMTRNYIPTQNHSSYSSPKVFSRYGPFRDDPVITLAFGAGRRICPGRHFVAATLFVVTASVLSDFNVRRATDKDGKEISLPSSASLVLGKNL